MLYNYYLNIIVGHTNNRSVNISIYITVNRHNTVEKMDYII